MKQKGLFVIAVLVGGLFAMGMGFDDVYAPKKPKEIVVVGSKIVEGPQGSETPVEGAECTIDAVNAEESTQIGKDTTNKQGKVTLIVKYDDPKGIVESVNILSTDPKTDHLVK